MTNSKFDVRFYPEIRHCSLAHRAATCLKIRHRLLTARGIIEVSGGAALSTGASDVARYSRSMVRVIL
jgi:hypothetical protein